MIHALWIQSGQKILYPVFSILYWAVGSTQQITGAL